MAIARLTPTADFPPVAQTPRIHDEKYQSLVYDDRHEPLNALISYMDGSPWALKYYLSQNTAQHNDLKMVDAGLDAQFQGYDKYNGLELLVDNDLSSSTDEGQQSTRVNGTALVPPFFVPNVGDHFVAETGYLSPALFLVQRVSRKTFRTQSAHEIEYKLVDYVDRLPEEMASLLQKVIREFQFDRTRMIEGLGGMVTTEKYADMIDLRQSYTMIGDYYLDTFIDRASKTLVFPGQTRHSIYDPNLVEFIMRTFSYDVFPRMLDIKELNRSGDKYLDQPQFFKAFLDRNFKSLQFGNMRMGFTRTGFFERSTWIKSLAHQRIDFIVYPKDPDLSVNSYESDRPMNFVDPDLIPTTNAQGKILTYGDKSFALQNKVIQSYPMVHSDDYYVLTENFYQNKSEELTLLELMVRDYMKNGTLDEKHIKHLVELFPRMERMEQFYYGPIIMTLIRYYDMRSY